MAIENEHKFILRDHGALLAHCRSALAETRLQQFYLSPEGRFRLVERDGAPPERLFTYKKATRSGLLEIETEVGPEDYEIARAEAQAVLTKLRFDLDEGSGHWSVDFLTEGLGGAVYFALAEVEFPVGGRYEMPGFLAPHVDLAVPHAANPRFANARLIDRAYAARIVEEFKAEARRRGQGAQVIAM